MNGYQLQMRSEQGLHRRVASAWISARCQQKRHASAALLDTFVFISFLRFIACSVSFSWLPCFLRAFSVPFFRIACFCYSYVIPSSRSLLMFSVVVWLGCNPVSLGMYLIAEPHLAMPFLRRRCLTSLHVRMRRPAQPSRYRLLSSIRHGTTEPPPSVSCQTVSGEHVYLLWF